MPLAKPPIAVPAPFKVSPTTPDLVIPLIIEPAPFKAPPYILPAPLAIPPPNLPTPERNPLVALDKNPPIPPPPPNDILSNLCNKVFANALKSA